MLQFHSGGLCVRSNRRLRRNTAAVLAQNTQPEPVGLAHEPEVSPRHICFLDTGRAKPSREMVMLLSRRVAASYPLVNFYSTFLTVPFASTIPMSRLA